MPHARWVRWRNTWLGAFRAVGEDHQIGVIAAPLVVVPHEHAHCRPEVAGQWIGLCRIGDGKVRKPDFAGRAAKHLVAATQRRGQDLLAKTDTKHRDVLFCRFADKIMFAQDPVDIFISAVGAAG